MSSTISIVVKFKPNIKNKSSNSCSINYTYNPNRNLFQTKKQKSQLHNYSNQKKHQNQFRTIFTSSTISNMLCTSQTPININQVNHVLKTKQDILDFSTSILKNVTLYEYDEVYNEQSSLNNIYNDYVKTQIKNLFQQRNACVVSFGPSDSGKENMFINVNNSSNTLLYKSINDIFNLIDNDTNYDVYLSAWLVSANDKVNKLLIKNKVLIKSYYQLEDYCLDILNRKRNISGLSNINDYDKKSHLVINVMLYKNSEYQSQIDFVELACVDFAYGHNDINKSIETSIHNLFRSIADINNTNNKTVLTSYLGNNTKLPYDILLINCIIPWEHPLNFSYKTIQISNAFRNYVHSNRFSEQQVNELYNSQTDDEKYIKETITFGGRANSPKPQSQVESEYASLIAKHNELKEDYDKMIEDFKSVKEEYQNKTKDVESKVDMLQCKIDKLQKENVLLNENQQNLKNEIKDKDDMFNKYKELYTAEKEKKLLIEKELNEIKQSKQNEMLKWLNKDSLQQIKLQTQNKFASEFKGNLNKYRELRKPITNLNTPIENNTNN